MNSSNSPSADRGIRLSGEDLSPLSGARVRSSVMRRTPSPLAQYSFSFVNRLESVAHHRRNPAKLIARAALKVASPLASSLGAGHLVSARLYGHDLLMPAEHALAPTLAVFPGYNRPLALTAQAVLDCAAKGSSLVVIDVGANIGDTVAMIEQVCPGSDYLCIEADSEIAELCRINHSKNPRVQVEQCFVGENEGLAVSLEDDGHANSSVRLLGEQAAPSADCDRIVRLDAAAGPFARTHGKISLIKVDTEGYDFSVLLSGSHLLREHLPALYFEWYPQLLNASGKGAWDGFEYLASLGYQHYVFFTNRGDYYCSIHIPDKSLIDTLACLTNHHQSIGYFDVLAANDKMVCERVEELVRRDMEPR